MASLQLIYHDSRMQFCFITYIEARQFQTNSQQIPKHYLQSCNLSDVPSVGMKVSDSKTLDILILNNFTPHSNVAMVTCFSTLTMMNSKEKQMRYPECKPCQTARNNNVNIWDNNLLPINFNLLNTCLHCRREMERKLIDAYI